MAVVPQSLFEKKKKKSLFTLSRVFCLSVDAIASLGETWGFPVCSQLPCFLYGAPL